MGRYLVPRSADDPMYVATPDEQLEATKKVTVADVAKFYADFYGANNAETAVVGDFDPTAVKSLLTELFGTWKSAKPYVRLTTSYADRPQSVESIEAPDKESAYFQAAERIQMKDDDSNYPAMILGNYMTGGGFINSRLATRIRRVEGLSYGVGSGFIAGPWDDDARFFAMAIYAPQNAEKLVAAFKDEMSKMLEKGFTADEIADAKKGWLQSRQVSRSQDRELVGALASRLEQGRTLAYDKDFEKSLSTLTGDQIITVMRKYIDLSKITMIQAGDFAKGKATATKTATP
jgi:zinc protease